MPRLLLPAFVLLLLAATPAPALAQQPQVFENCASWSLDNVSGQLFSEGRTVFQGPGIRVTCDDVTLYADEIAIVEVDDATTMVYARGNVLFSTADLRLTADSAELNGRTKLGAFRDAAGHYRLQEGQYEKSMFGTAEPLMDFWGAVVERTGPQTYIIVGGNFTACAQPTPRWEIGGSSVRVTLKKHVMLWNAVFRVKNVPILYLPFFYYPLSEDDRSTGFLIPTYSTSTIRGQGLSEAFFLAMGRSQDATFYYDWYSKGGKGLGAEYRYAAAPGSEGAFNFYRFDEKQRLGADGVTIERPEQQYYDVRGRANQAMPNGFRLIGNVNYFSDVTTRQLYDQDVYQSSQRQRSFDATLSGNLGRVRLSAAVNQRDFFYNADQAQRHGALPTVNLSLPQQPIGRSRVYAGAGGTVSYLVSQFDINDPATDRSLLRTDVSPTLRASVSSLAWLDVTTNASYRHTFWQRTIDPETQLIVDEPLSRQLLEVGATVRGPKVQRIFTPQDNGYAERFKHLIEPTFSVSWVSPFDEINRVVRIDGVDGVVGGTGTFTYGLTNTLLARRRTEGPGPGTIRDILIVRVTQTYYTKAEAALYDYQYGTATQSQSPFSPLRINVQAKPSDSFSADFNTEIDAEFRTPRQFSATGRYTTTQVQVNAGWSKRRTIPGLPGYEDPRFATHLINAGTALRNAANTFGGTFDMNFDVLNKTMLRQRIVAYYNAQCCGIQFDYQSVSYAGFGLSTIPADRRFSVSFTLAGIGSFSNPFGSFGNNGGRY